VVLCAQTSRLPHRPNTHASTITATVLVLDRPIPLAKPRHVVRVIPLRKLQHRLISLPVFIAITQLPRLGRAAPTHELLDPALQLRRGARVVRFAEMQDALAPPSTRALGVLSSAWLTTDARHTTDAQPALYIPRHQAISSHSFATPCPAFASAHGAAHDDLRGGQTHSSDLATLDAATRDAYRDRHVSHP